MTFQVLELSVQGEVTVAVLRETDSAGAVIGIGPHDAEKTRRLRGGMGGLCCAVSGALLIDVRGDVRWTNHDGVAQLIRLFRSKSEVVKPMALCGLSANLTDMFRLTNLDRLIPCFPNRDAAVRLLTDESRRPGSSPDRTNA